MLMWVLSITMIDANGSVDLSIFEVEIRQKLSKTKFKDALSAIIRGGKFRSEKGRVMKLFNNIS